MPTDNHATTTTDDRPWRVCPFDWCTEPHVDDWRNDDAGDPERSHTTLLPDHVGVGFEEKWVPYLFVIETRTLDGVRYSAAEVHAGDHEPAVPVDTFRAGFDTVVRQLPAWSAAALAVEDLRTAAAR